MPIYEEVTFNYEILLRFGDSGETQGKLTGAHLVTITRTTKDGVPIATVIDPPQQLALLEGEAGLMLHDVLGKVSTSTIIENQILRESIESRDQTISELILKLNHAVNNETRLDQQVERLTAIIAELSHESSSVSPISPSA